MRIFFRSLLLLAVGTAVPAVALQVIAGNGSTTGAARSQTDGTPGDVAATSQDRGGLNATNCSPDVSQKATPSSRPGTKYTPLSAHCKFTLFLRQTYSPYTFASVGFEATWAQATDQWPHYGGGTEGFGKRFGASLADTESRRFIQSFALSTVLHQDPRYFPSHKKGLLTRAWYASTRVVVGKTDTGRSTFNSAEFMGALFTSALQNAYYPRHDRNFGDTMKRFEGALSSDATSYILREFTPDIKRLLRKHTPEKVKQIEKKLPIPEDDKP